MDNNDEDVFAPQTWPKPCTCCAKTFTFHAWTCLRLIGVQKGFVDGLPDLELRNCDVCESTLAMVIVPENAAAEEVKFADEA